VNAHCLYRFDEPVSPHLAAGMAAEKAGTGAQVSIIIQTRNQVYTHFEG
jgi:dethiobiotin synthetase